MYIVVITIIYLKTTAYERLSYMLLITQTLVNKRVHLCFGLNKCQT